jgi:hypothetical protein
MKTSVINYHLNKGRKMRDAFIVSDGRRWSAQSSGKPDQSKMKTSVINYRLNKGRTMRDVLITSEGRPERPALVSTGHSPVLTREPNPKP